MGAGEEEKTTSKKLFLKIFVALVAIVHDDAVGEGA